MKRILSMVAIMLVAVFAISGIAMAESFSFIGCTTDVINGRQVFMGSFEDVVQYLYSFN